MSRVLPGSLFHCKPTCSVVLHAVCPLATCPCIIHKPPLTIIYKCHIINRKSVLPLWASITKYSKASIPFLKQQIILQSHSAFCGWFSFSDDWLATSLSLTATTNLCFPEKLSQSPFLSHFLCSCSFLFFGEAKANLLKSP